MCCLHVSENFTGFNVTLNQTEFYIQKVTYKHLYIITIILEYSAECLMPCGLNVHSYYLENLF